MDQPKLSFPALLDGLISDVRNLLRQELQFARHELQIELANAKTGLASVGLAAGLVSLGELLLLLMIVHLLVAVTGLPLWASYGIVGSLLIGAGSLLMLWARARASEMRQVPQETVKTIRETALWLKKHASNRI